MGMGQRSSVRSIWLVVLPRRRREFDESRESSSYMFLYTFSKFGVDRPDDVLDGKWRGEIPYNVGTVMI